MANKAGGHKSLGEPIKAILDAVDTLVMVLDMEGRVVHANGAAEKELGYSRAQLEGQEFQDYLVEEEDVIAFRTILDVLGAGISPCEYTARVGMQDGKQRIVQWSNTVSSFGAEAARYVVATGHDVSEEIELNKDLNDRRSLLDAITETVPSALISIDEAGVVQSFSLGAETLFGYTEDEVIGQKVDSLMPSPYRDEHDGYITNYLNSGKKRIIGIGRIVVGRRKDGTTFPMELAVGEAATSAGRLFVGAVRDIAAREGTERQVHQLQTNLMHASRLSAMGEMSSALAHELNQPLSALMSYIDAAQHLMERNLRPEQIERIQEMLDKAGQQARRAGQIVHHLRQYVFTGETEKLEEDLNTVIQDSLAMALIGVTHGDILVNLDLGQRLPAALIDRVQIQQVVVNLVRNALEALEETDMPSLRLASSQADDQFLLVIVRDNGPGLDPNVVDQIFHPFTTTKPKGVGMGLSICRSIVESHRGQIWAEPNPTGGAIFKFTLPVAAEPADGWAE